MRNKMKLVIFYLALASFMIILIASSYSWSDDSTLVQNVSDCGILNTTNAVYYTTGENTNV